MMTFATAEDGTVRLDGAWEPTARISLALVEQADPRYLRYDGERVEITVANGAATYRITERDDEAGMLTAALVWFRTDHAHTHDYLAGAVHLHRHHHADRRDHHYP